MNETVDPMVLGEMVDYYRARAAEYDQWWDRVGRFDRGAEVNGVWLREREEVYAAFDGMELRGHVLELAPGTGIWTKRIVKTAEKVMAVDASPEMIEINKVKVASGNVEYVVADLFGWEPPLGGVLPTGASEPLFDAVVFGFWISHVPRERLEGFLKMVAGALKVGGRVFFVDGLKEATSTAKDHVLPGREEQCMTRKLNDGRAYRIVKNFYEGAELEEACRRVGLRVKVGRTGTYFYYGIGTRRDF